MRACCTPRATSTAGASTRITRPVRSAARRASTTSGRRRACTSRWELVLVEERSAEALAVHRRDVMHADLLRARCLALAVQRAAAEALLVVLRDHPPRPTRALRLALREQRQV